MTKPPKTIGSEEEASREEMEFKIEPQKRNVCDVIVTIIFIIIIMSLGIGLIKLLNFLFGVF